VSETPAGSIPSPWESSPWEPAAGWGNAELEADGLLQIGPDQADQRLVVLHGWGADADDLLDLGAMLVGPEVQVVALRAPHPHPGGVGCQWYDLPEVNEALAKSLGIKEGTIEALRADIKRNLEREVKFRVLARNKAAVMDALVKGAELDVPGSLVNGESERMIEAARADLKQRGVKDADKAPIPAEMFKPQAERRVRLGLVVGELVRANSLQARPDQLQAHIEEMAQSYEKPSEVVRWYLGDRQRMAEVEAVVVENNVTQFVLGQAKVIDKQLPFDELMAAS